MCISKFTSISKKAITALCIAAFCIISQECASNEHDPFTSYNGYSITLPPNYSAEDAKWTEYLFTHLQKRSMKSKKITYLTVDKDFYELQVRILPSLKHDFQIDCSKGKILLSAHDSSTLLWLIYQLMKNIGDEDEAIDASDLPPAILNLKDSVGDFPFEYREAYLPNNINSDFSNLMGVNNVDQDWGLWGHHLPQVIGKNPNPSVFATVDGQKYEDQLCFSSEILLQDMTQYILSNFGDGRNGKKKFRFAIFPNDDPVSCTCELCKRKGNTATNATPAVTDAIIKLAKRFPNYQFFTSSYLSTSVLPTEKLPSNVGVIISTMNIYPMKSGKSVESSKFTDLVERWLKLTSTVYVWDYINNFDDYFTPFPILKIEQQRIQYFRRLGVKGVFLNGSGTQYSSLCDLHHFVLSSLLINPDFVIDDLVQKYLLQSYPSLGKRLADDYIKMLDEAMQSNKVLNIYGGIDDNLKSCFKPSSFLALYNDVHRGVSKTNGEEHDRLVQLDAALSLARLELSRTQPQSSFGCLVGNGTGIRPEIKDYMAALSNYSKYENMPFYRENSGDVAQYISDWQQYILNVSHNNLLEGKAVIALTKLDEDYQRVEILTDGIHGLPSNYHSGWLISSVGSSLNFSLPVVRSAKTFKISFLHAPKYHLMAPQKVVLLKNGRVFATYRPSVHPSLPFQMIEVGGTVNLSDASSLEVHIVRADGKRQNIACDEIQLNP